MDCFHCPNCGRSIPLINQVVHTARCVPRPSRAVEVHDLTANNPMEMEALRRESHPTPSCPADRWSCIHCTYMNMSQFDLCEMCDSHRAANESECEGSVQSSSFSDAARGNHVPFRHEDNAAPTARTSRWECLNCTYRNRGTADTCSMCGNSRPAQPAYNEQLLPNEDLTSPMVHAAFASLAPSAARSDRVNTSASSVTSATLLGAGIGAGLAWLNNGSITRGALEGAGIGALGGLLLQTLDAQLQQEQEQHPVFGNRIDMHDVMFQDMLLRLTEVMEEAAGQGQGQQGYGRGLDERALQALPTHVYSRSSHSSESHSHSRTHSQEQCSICLSQFETGDALKSLPCMHSYHSSCIDRWLAQSRQCPVCKHSIG